MYLKLQILLSFWANSIEGCYWVAIKSAPDPTSCASYKVQLSLKIAYCHRHPLGHPGALGAVVPKRVDQDYNKGLVRAEVAASKDP